MHEPAESARPRHTGLPRRRVRPRLVLVLVVLVVLIGRGFGLFGGGGEPENPVVAPEVAPSAEGAGSQSAASQGVGAGAPAPTPPAAGAAGTATGQHEGAENGAPVGAAAVPAPASGSMEADRFASLLSLVEARCEQGQFGGALSVLRRAQDQPLDATQRTNLQKATQNVRDGAEAACRDAVQALSRGEVLAVHETITEMLADGAEHVRPLVTKALGTAGDPATLPPQGDRPWPIPAPLPKERSVRVRLPEAITAGRIVDSRSDQATVRIQGPNGVTFPTLPVAACEPIDPTSAEALEMGLAALHAGDALLARLWYRCAGLRGTPPAARAAQLADILR